jgi:hypothetical protein
MATPRSQAPTPTQQLAKVKQASNLMQAVLGLVSAFYGIGLVLGLIGLVMAGSFQLSLGDGDLAITYFSQEPAQAVVTLYDGKTRFGVNLEDAAPAAREVVRVVTMPTTELRIAAAVMLLMNTAVVLLVLHHLGQLFHLYARGEIFTSAVVRRIRLAGYALIGFPMVELANSGFGIALVSHMDATPSPAHIAMSPAMAVAALVVLMISWIMDVGRGLQDEQAQTI